MLHFLKCNGYKLACAWKRSIRFEYTDRSGISTIGEGLHRLSKPSEAAKNAGPSLLF